MLVVVFGAILAAFDLALLLAGVFLRARLDRTAVQGRPDAILFLRFLPFTLALTLLVVVFVPAWLRFEPAHTDEQASILLVAAAAIALLPAIYGGHRAARILRRTNELLRLWTRDAFASRVTRGCEVIEVRRHDMGLCVGGYFRPAIYASRDVIDLLEPEEFKAALAHETSHARAKDPLRLLLMGACPDFLHLFGFDEAWRREFARACELAADAGASEGNPALALDLASALVKVARFNGPGSARGFGDVVVAGVSEASADLEFRVRALTETDPTNAGATRRLSFHRFLAPAVFGLASIGYLAGPNVHTIAEHVGRLLAP